MRILLLFIFFGSLTIHGQVDFLEGTWQGIVTTHGQEHKNGTAVWFSFAIDASSSSVSGESRLETPFTNYYAYKNIRGKVIGEKEVTFEDVMIGAQKNTGGKFWCLNKGTLSYDDATGYLSGNWTSTDCRRQAGEIILYRSKYKMSKTDTLTLYHSWFNNMASDISRGWNAYYVRDAEMQNFEFIPVYFEHDKDDLRADFEGYLEQMAQIVNSHSDLRIKIIGHTDSNGSDSYNINLSERRAENVKEYLMKTGISADKIVIEYRGENDPATSNSTSDGKRLNRRVDFEFI